MRVSVVIPTTGRESLLRAVASALGQTVPPTEVIVVDDATTSALPAAVTENAAVTVVRTGGRGGGAARNAGVRAANAELVALLDDDDEWWPEKLARQVELYRANAALSGSPVVVACRQAEVDTRGRVALVMPRRLIGDGERIADYLFAKRQIRPGEAGISSSMLLARRSVFLTVPFDESLTRHQDWDWLLRVESLTGAGVTIHPDTLVTYQRQPVGASVSSGGSWTESLAWIEGRSDLLSRRQQANLIMTVTAPVAVRNRQWRAALALSGRAVRMRPSLAALLFFLVDSVLAASRGRRVRRAR